MSLFTEIAETSAQPGFNKFSSGQDNWHNPQFIAERTELVERAKDGCVNSKYVLMAKPYNITKLILDGKTII